MASQSFLVIDLAGKGNSSRGKKKSRFEMGQWQTHVFFPPFALFAVCSSQVAGLPFLRLFVFSLSYRTPLSHDVIKSPRRTALGEREEKRDTGCAGTASRTSTSNPSVGPADGLQMDLAHKTHVCDLWTIVGLLSLSLMRCRWSRGTCSGEAEAGQALQV